MKTRGKLGPAARMLLPALCLGLLLVACSREEKSPPKFINSLGMEFRWVPAGSFLMGSSQQDQRQMMADFKRAAGRSYRKEWGIHIRDETPQHEVRITRPYYIQSHEVTNDQFAAFVKATGYRTIAEGHGGGWNYTPDGWRPLPGADWRRPSGPDSSIQGKGDHPVVQVSWLDAMAFCRWLSDKESKPYALPSEAQWEYACRGGRRGTLYSWGKEMPPTRQVANMPDMAYARQVGKQRHHVLGYDDGYAGTAPVGKYEANQFGLHDMIGNVWEWCGDWYDAGYYAVSPAKDPTGPPKGTHRVLRGGSFCYLPSNLRCADRFRNLPGFRCPFAGFRLVLAVSDPQSRTPAQGTERP